MSCSQLIADEVLNIDRQICLNILFKLCTYAWPGFGIRARRLPPPPELPAPLVRVRQSRSRRRESSGCVPPAKRGARRGRPPPPCRPVAGGWGRPPRPSAIARPPVRASSTDLPPTGGSRPVPDAPSRSAGRLDARGTDRARPPAARTGGGLVVGIGTRRLVAGCREGRRRSPSVLRRQPRLRRRGGPPRPLRVSLPPPPPPGPGRIVARRRNSRPFPASGTIPFGRPRRCLVVLRGCVVPPRSGRPRGRRFSLGASSPPPPRSAAPPFEDWKSPPPTSFSFSSSAEDLVPPSCFGRLISFVPLFFFDAAAIARPRP